MSRNDVETMRAYVATYGDQGYYPPVAVEVTETSAWFRCAAGHRWDGINPADGCRTCREDAKFRMMGRPDCVEDGCQNVVKCSQRAWEAGVRKCEMHWTQDRSREWNTGIVTIDGYHTHWAVYSNHRWNGWAMPSFDAWSCQRIIDTMLSEGQDEYYAFDWDPDTLELVITQKDGDDEYVERLAPDADGLYALGAGSWVWEDYDGELDPDIWIFLSQNRDAGDTMTAEDVVRVHHYAQHHAGGMFVLAAHLDDGRFVKMHDTWGDPEDGKIVVHVYDPDAEDIERTEVVEYFNTGHEAVTRFVRYEEES